MTSYSFLVADSVTSLVSAHNRCSKNACSMSEPSATASYHEWRSTVTLIPLVTSIKETPYRMLC